MLKYRNVADLIIQCSGHLFKSLVDKKIAMTSLMGNESLIRKFA